MKAISVRQPWAWLLFHGKRVENRDWYCGHRGVLGIQAALKMTRYEYDDACDFVYRFDPVLAKSIPSRDSLVYGAMLGSVLMTDCVTEHSSPFFLGQFGHVYTDPRLLALPVPRRGQLGIWDCPEEARFAIAVQRGGK